MTRRLIKILFLACALSAPVFAADETFSLNLNNADIRALISTVSEMTGKNFIVDPRVKGKVTIISASPSNRDQIYEIFLSVLKVHGFTVVPSGQIIKIVPDTVAKQDSIRTIVATEDGSDEPVTRVIELQHISAAQLIPVLRPLLPQQAHLAAHADSNTLIISDSSANVTRITHLVERIDRVGSPEVEVITLQYANAADLVQVLNSLRQGIQQGKATAQQPVMVADQRTNSILLGGDPTTRLELRTLITHLDTPMLNEGNTEVIYLRYAKAKDLVTVLKGVGAQHKDMAGEGKAPSKTEGEFDIQADESTNALVVTAPPALMRSLKSVINQLDIRRAQVHIEAIIAELTDDKAVEFGVEWQTGTPTDIHTSAFADTRLPITSAVSSGIGTFPGSIGSGFSLGFFRNGDLRALIKAFASDGDTNILSTPSLVTLDNEEASIHVGKNVPFVTGQYSTTTGSDPVTNPFQTIERHDVGIKLNVLPQINEGDTIKLKIEQEVSSVDTTTSGAGLQTNKRNINTTVLVDDKQTIVLGGLIKDDLKETESKVPLLGDIPVLGLLFKNTRSSLEKTNLMVFLRPEIIRDQRTGNQLTQSKYSYIRQLQEDMQAGGVKLMPKQQPSLLPTLQLDAPRAPTPPAPDTSGIR